MSLKGHIWFRVGWYRSISGLHSYKQWLRRLHRLSLSGSRARQMGLEFKRIESGGLENIFLDRGLDI
jgi:hypothetical protein